MKPTTERDPWYPGGQRDASIWVTEFFRIYPVERERPDADTMLGWFANAIETGVMFGRREAAAGTPDVAALRVPLSFADVRHWHLMGCSGGPDCEWPQHDCAALPDAPPDVGIDLGPYERDDGKWSLHDPEPYVPDAPARESGDAALDYDRALADVRREVRKLPGLWQVERGGIGKLLDRLAAAQPARPESALPQGYNAAAEGVAFLAATVVTEAPDYAPTTDETAP